MQKKIITHFRKNDPVLYSVLRTNKLLRELEISKSDNHFRSLCREIIGQQLASKAAHKIFERFIALFPNGHVTPEEILQLSDQKIRATGPSWSKVRFIKDLAQKVVNKKLKLDTLLTMDDAEIIQTLTQVKGIGPWTAEMFLIFAMGREDVFSHGDYGLKKSMKRIYKFKKDPSREQIESIVHKWSPYRTYGCLILWHYSE